MPRRRPLSVRNPLESPIRNLLSGAAFVLAVMGGAIVGYGEQGWSWADSVYMVVLTVFSVGYDEVRPVNTPELRAITIALIIAGCTGMIFMTGALIQLITASQLSEFLGDRRMLRQIDRLDRHVIVCGFGRVGQQLVRALRSARNPFVIVELDEDRVAEATTLGLLCVRGDATEESVLLAAGILRARAIVTVLPQDALNVFITLTARSLNEHLSVIARGEAPSTEAKLLQAGASRVIMPAHLGAERIAEILLFPDAAAPVGLERIRGELQSLGVELEMVVVEEHSPWVGRTVQEIEAAAVAPLLVVEIERAGTMRRERAEQDSRINAGDGVVVIGRNTEAAFSGSASVPECG